MPISTVECCDCMDFMAKFPDKYFDLAIVDPPYGIGNFVPQNVSKKGKKAGEKVTWNDNIPCKEYFNQLYRVSQKQIIWGANYYNCFTKDGGAVVWDKGEANPLFSRCEIASLSFQKRVDYIFINWQSGFYRASKEKIIHACQKPIALYQRLLQSYAKPGDKILDTHMGSQSSRIAAYQMGFDFWGCEIDPEYFEQGCKRFEKEASQQALFTPETTIREQNKLFDEGLGC